MHNMHTPPPVEPKGGGLSVASLVLGIVAIVLSFMPIINNLTAAGGVVGVVLGLIDLRHGRRGRRVMNIVGAALGAAGLALTVVAQQQFVDDLDELDQEIERDIDDLERDIDDCAEKFAEWDPTSGQDPPSC